MVNVSRPVLSSGLEGAKRLAYASYLWDTDRAQATRVGPEGLKMPMVQHMTYPASKLVSDATEHMKPVVVVFARSRIFSFN